MGAGVIYSTLGGTHHTQEDIAIAGAIPNMQIIAPCDPAECTEATTLVRHARRTARSICASARPASRTSPRAPSRGSSARSATCGAAPMSASCPTACITKMAAEVADRLQAQGKSVSLVSVHTVKPLDREGIADALKRHKQVDRDRGARAAGRSRAADQADRLGHAGAPASSTPSRSRTSSSTTTAAGRTFLRPTASRFPSSWLRYPEQGI